MNRLNATAMFAAVLLGELMFPQQSEAGRVRYDQCFTSLGNKTDGIKATLQAGGLFYSWKGSLVNETVAANFKKCEATAAIFTGSSAAGVNSITIATFANNKTVPLNGHLLFSSIRNNTALDDDPMKTTLTNVSIDSGTKVGPADPKVVGDPQILITNGGGSVMVLTSIVAQINNTQDPLDPDIDFVPDGSPATILPILHPSNAAIFPGETGIFSFDIGNAVNWSFQYTYSYNDDVFTDLLASDVPEPSSFTLLAIAFVSLILVVGQFEIRAIPRGVVAAGK